MFSRPLVPGNTPNPRSQVYRTGAVLRVLIVLTALLPALPARSRADAARWFSLARPLPRAVIADKGAVAAAHPLAAKAGVDILRAGGNAIDALVATQMVLNVVEPESSGIGGGCFILYYDAKTRQTYCIDGREEVPSQTQRSDFLDAGGRVKKDAITGGLAVGVPGTVAAMWLAHGRWGRLAIARVLEPAIKIAEEGAGITPRLRASIATNRSRLLHFPSSRAVFLHADSSVPEIGEVLKQADLAGTLRLLAAQGPKAFYEGAIARDMVKAVRSASYQPGKLALNDLKAYRAVHREPVRFSYHGHEIVSVPPPSAGGLTLGIMLGILEKAEWKSIAPGSLKEIDLLARAGATAFADRSAYLGDQDWSPQLDMRGLLKREFIQARMEAARKAAPAAQVSPGPAPKVAAPSPRAATSERFETSEALPALAGFPEGKNTSHISIVDADRNVLACTTTIENGMGSGLVVDGRGFLLNNELTDFDLERDSGPNALDASRRPRHTALGDNREPGGKRPRSSMTPVIVFKDGRPYLTVGSPGGTYIIGVVGQVLHNVLDQGMDMQQALNAPRISSQNQPLELELLYPDRQRLLEALRAKGWKVRGPHTWQDAVFGNAHGVRLRPDGRLEAGADPRLEGGARGY